MSRLTLYSLMAAGAVLSAMPAYAQTKVSVSTSTNAVPTPVSSPMIQPDTLKPNQAGMPLPQGDDKSTRINRKQRRKNQPKTDKTFPPDTSSHRPE